MEACHLCSVFLSFFLSSLLGTRMPPSDTTLWSIFLLYSELGTRMPPSDATLWSVFLSSLLGTRNSDATLWCHPLICLSFFFTRNSELGCHPLMPPSDLSFFLLYSELGTRNSDATLSLICLSFFFTRNSDATLCSFFLCSELGTRMPPSDATLWFHPLMPPSLWSVFLSSLLGTRNCCHPPHFGARNSELGTRSPRGALIGTIKLSTNKNCYVITYTWRIFVFFGPSIKFSKMKVSFVESDEVRSKSTSPEHTICQK